MFVFVCERERERKRERERERERAREKESVPREPLSTCLCATYIQGSEVTRFAFGTYLGDHGMTRCGEQILNILQ